MTLWDVTPCSLADFYKISEEGAVSMIILISRTKVC